MSSIDVPATRRRLTDLGLCPDSDPGITAEFLDGMLDEALTTYVDLATLDRWIERVFEQWRTERAEILAQQAQFLADIRCELNEFREEDSARERRRDTRERERDEREWQRLRDQESRDAKMRNWVLGMVGLGFAATTLVTGLLITFG